jgi:hypothetical protein
MSVDTYITNGSLQCFRYYVSALLMLYLATYCFDFGPYRDTGC